MEYLLYKWAYRLGAILVVILVILDILRDNIRSRR
jgi:hypothetical protein